MARIYISSTKFDLEDYRKEVSLGLRRLGHEDVAMEYYVASEERPVEKCLRDVASCALYIGIFAWRYGYVPGENNPEGRSITEMEYRQAVSEHIPCLIFMVSEDAPWPRSKQDKGAAAERIEAFRQELGKNHVVDFFENADELTRKVNEAVIQWDKNNGQPGSRQLTDWDTYRKAVYNKHQWVRLQVIAGAIKERGVTKIPLTEVFESQLATARVFGTDVPDEVRKYQEVIYGPRTPVSYEGEAEGTDDSAEPADTETDEPLLSSNPELVVGLVGREPTQVILGGPGSGKSTILHYTMLRLCQPGSAQDAPALPKQGAPLPFLIELRDYVIQREKHKAPDFISYIVQRASGFYDAPIEAENLETVLGQEGQALVFFDGLDEVFDADERRQVIDQFQTFAHHYPRAHLVVTSRIAGYDRTALGLAGFTHYTLLPLTLAQIRHFAGQWYKYYTLEGTERTAQGLVQRIIESPRLLDLAGNPLLLTMMAVIYKDRDLPNERWRLYQRCAETLLEEWELGKGIEVEDFKLPVLVRTAQKSEILQRVSMYMLEHSQQGRELNAIAYGPLLDIMAGYLEEKYKRPRGDAEAIAVDILRHLSEETYVLAGIGERVFGFVHRTFMEYFAACRCLAQFNASKADFAWLNREIFGAHWQGGEWEEVLLLLIAMLHDQGTPIREVVESIRNEKRGAVPFNAAFAARCLGEAGDVQDPGHGQALLTELAQGIAVYAPKSRGKEARAFVETALKAFASLAPFVPTPKAVQEAISQLNQVGTVANRMAAWQMNFALRTHKERLEYALAALQDNEEAVRRGAIAAIEREWPGRAAITPALLAAAKNDRKARVRHAALDAMLRSWRLEPAILEAIDARAGEEAELPYKTRLIEYLADTWWGNPTARDLVMKIACPNPDALYNSDSPSLYGVAGKALRNGWGSDAGTLQQLEQRVAQDPNSFMRAAYAQVLTGGWSGDSTVLAFLQERANTDADPQICAALIRCIASGWAGNAQIRAYLEECGSQAADARLRAAAARGLAEGWGDDAGALDFLIKRALNDPEPAIRAAVIRSIGSGWGGNAGALSFLQDRMMNDPDPHMQLVCVEGLIEGWNHDAAVLEFLQNHTLKDAEPQIQLAVVQAIPYYWGFNPQMFAIYQDRATHDQDAHIRSTLMEELANRWGSDDQITSFLMERGRQDPDPQTRASVAWSLSRWCADDPRVLDFLIDRVLADPDPETCAAVLRDITSVWSENAQALAFVQAQAANHPDPNLRLAVLETLIDGWNGDPKLWEFIQDRSSQDGDPQVRAAVVRAAAKNWMMAMHGLDFLQERISHDPDAHMRAEGIQGLCAGVQQAWGFDVPDYEPYIDRALKILRDCTISDPDIGVRVQAIRTTGQLMEDSSIKGKYRDFLRLLILEIHKTQPDAQIRAAVLRVMAKSNLIRLKKKDADLAFLREQANVSPLAELRSDALWAIAMGWTDKIQALALLEDRAMHDAEPQPRTAALQALAAGWKGDEKALGLLQDRARTEPDAQTRMAAIEGFEANGKNDQENLTFLQERARHDPEPTIRWGCLQTIARYLMDADIAAFFQDCMQNDPDPDNRRHLNDLVMQAERAILERYYQDEYFDRGEGIHSFFRYYY